MAAYGADLAYVNDAGFADFSEGVIPGLFTELRRAGIRSGVVVDLGCGAGRWAAALDAAGYAVTGVDQSMAMLTLARKRAPRVRFVHDSALSAILPECDAVTAIGEVLSYTFDPTYSRRSLGRLFRRVYRALRPGGIFLFDLAGPDRLPDEIPCHFADEGADWRIEATVDGSRGRRRMTRHLRLERRRPGGRILRAEETHNLRLYQPESIVSELHRIGFTATVGGSFGRSRLYAGMHAFLARKPV